MKKLVFGILILFSFTARGQQKNWQFNYNGYLDNLQGVFFDSLKNQFYTYNLIHNRFNFDLYYKTYVQVHASVRNRLFTGDIVKPQIPGSNETIASSLEQTTAFFDLSHNFANEPGFILNSQIDRLFTKLTFNNIEITLGRQRINWAKTLVWNPNDIFNTYSVFEVDYPERPGVDAVDAVAYFGTSSSVELAASLKKDLLTGDTLFTAAIKGATTVKNFDIQTIAGVYHDSSFVTAFGWAGYVGNITWRGEMTSLFPKDFQKLQNVIISTGFDYTLPNSTMLMAELAYNKNGDKAISDLFLQGAAGGTLASLYFAPSDVNHITLARYNVFAQAVFQVTPLVTLNAGGMLMFDNFGYMLMPSVDFSLTQNVDFSVIAQAGLLTVPVFSPDLQQNVDVKFRTNAIFLKLSYNFGR